MEQIRPNMIDLNRRPPIYSPLATIPQICAEQIKLTLPKLHILGEPLHRNIHHGRNNRRQMLATPRLPQCMRDPRRAL